MLVAGFRLRTSRLYNRPDMVLVTNRKTIQIVITGLHVRHLSFDATEDKDALKGDLLGHQMPFNLTELVQAQCLTFLVCHEANCA